MDAILALTSSQPPPFMYTCTSKSSTCVCVYMRVLSKTTLAPPQKLLISDAVAASSLLSHRLPHSSAPPRAEGRPAVLLTGVICASGIDVVCWPIKIFEGNVYFLERIAPAACKPF